MWKFEFSSETRKFLEKANERLRNSLLGKIRNVGRWLDGQEELGTDFKKLKGEWEGYYRIKLGNVRVIVSLEKEEKVIRIHDIGYRGDVYKK